MTRKVKFCVILAAGKGTRWAPLTDYIPKEMLDLDGKPTIYWIIKEAVDSGCSEIVVVINKTKNLIKKYLESRKEFTSKVNLHFVYQNKIRGVAEAIYLTKSIIGDNPFGVIVADHPCFYKVAPLKQMQKIFNKLPEQTCLVSFSKYPEYNNKFSGQCLLKKYGEISKIIHLCPAAKIPKDLHHPGDYLRISGRYIFWPGVFPFIKETLKSCSKSDISDWDVFEIASSRGVPYWAVEIKSLFLEIGTPENYGQATLRLFQDSVKQTL